MDLQEAIKNRRTIHSFNTTKVPEIVIERAIDAANHAPCHRLTFPWRFTSVGKMDRELLAILALQLKFGIQKIESSVEAKINSKIMDPSHLLVASQISTNDPKSKLEDYAACSCAIQNLLLSLAGDGVGSKWSTGKITSHQKTYEIIGIDPLVEEIIGFIWVGYGQIPDQINRPPLKSIFRRYEGSK